MTDKPIKGTFADDDRRAGEALSDYMAALHVAGPWVPVRLGWQRALVAGQQGRGVLVVTMDQEGPDDAPVWRVLAAGELMDVLPETYDAAEVSGAEVLRRIDAALAHLGWFVAQGVAK